MPNTLESVQELPDVSFTDDDTLDAMMQRLINNYEARYEEITGKKRSLSASDPVRILLYAVALDLFQLEQYVDRAGKQDLLKYSYGEFLDNLAAGRGVTRIAASAATTTIRFTLSGVKAYAVGIPAGTRVTNGDGIYFQTTQYAEVPIGSLTVDVEAECTVDGIEGNDLVAGQINILVDPVAYVQSVVNTDTSAGGAATESDESLAERVYLAPSSYSVAGPSDAYVYWAKTYNTNIGSVMPVTPNPGEVDLYVLMADGSLPGAAVISGIKAYLDENECRPMTDLVTVKQPTVVTYNINLTYYINQSDSSRAATIQQEVQNAVAEYITWQSSEIGRDINPDELLQKIKAAGAKRATITAPVFTVVASTNVAMIGTKTVSYGGLEDD